MEISITNLTDLCALGGKMIKTSVRGLKISIEKVYAKSCMGELNTDSRMRFMPPAVKV
jgi:hypothetical protein